MATYTYQPDYVALPGETLLEALEERNMSQTALAQRMGRSRKLIHEIIHGKARIDEETALELEQVLSIPASLWLNLEQNYREHRARMEQTQRFATQTNWNKNFPIREMIKRGWLTQTKDLIEQLRQLLS